MDGVAIKAQPETRARMHFFTTSDASAFDPFISAIRARRGGVIQPGVISKFDSPYPGLRPFQPEEKDLFYGRADQLDAMLS